MLEISISNQKVWWNTGNETKPSLKEFQKFTFKKALNFNVSWVDEMHIQVIVPKNEQCSLIKIESDDDTPRIKYFYLSDVLDKTKVNSTCIFALDIWLTYMVNSNDEVRTIKTLDVSKVEKTINIQPNGMLSGKIQMRKEGVFDRINWFTTSDYKFQDVDKTDYSRYDIGGGVTTNIYYVFLSKETISMDSRKKASIPNYIAIPVLNWNFCKIYQDVKFETTGIIPGTHTKKIPYINDWQNLQTLSNHATEMSHTGLGKFLGVYVGPNCLRLKNQGIENIYDVKEQLTNYKIKSSNIIFEGRRDLFTYNDIYPNPSGWAGFIAFRFNAEGIELQPLNEIVSIHSYLDGSLFLNDPNIHIYHNSDRVFFNNGFCFSNCLETINISIEIPVSYDGYYDLINAQKERMNTSLGLAAGKSLLSVASAVGGLVNLGPSVSVTTKTGDVTRNFSNYNEKVITGKLQGIDRKWGKQGGRDVLKGTTNRWAPDIIRPFNSRGSNKTTYNTTTRTESSSPTDWLGALNGITGGAMQFFSTLAQQEAYKKDLRTQTSGTVMNPNDKYISWYMVAMKMVTWYNGEFTVNDFLDIQMMELFWGAEIIDKTLMNYYGHDSQPITVNLSQAENEYILIPETDHLKYQLELGDKYSPNIKNAILSLLTNGIRIMTK